jgi:Ser/Thr protein kinase RdoA (MazF antagonist)
MAARLARALRGFFHPAARHELLWDLTQVPALRTRTHHIEEQGRRRVVEEVLDHFGAEVLPQLKIAELIREHPDPIAAAAEITAGYHAVTALEDDELRLIFDLVSTRCAMEVAVANWRVCDHPENTDYIMAGNREAGAQLDQMREWGAERMYTALRRACATSVSIEVSDAHRAAPATSRAGIGTLLRQACSCCARRGCVAHR